MQITYSDERGWLIVTLVGNAEAYGAAGWSELRRDFPWDRGTKLIIEVHELDGASDAAVGALMGLTADAHHRGGRVVVVGESDDLRARISVLGMEGYIRTAWSVEQARATLDIAPE